MTSALTAAPIITPVSLSETKTHLRVDHSHEDDLIEKLIRAACDYTEFASGQKLIDQTWRLYVQEMPLGGNLEPPLSPVRYIEAITGFNADGSPHILAPDHYELCLRAKRPTIKIAAGFDRKKAANGLEIDIVCGFGASADKVPETLRHAILLLVTHWYEFRGAITPQNNRSHFPLALMN